MFTSNAVRCHISACEMSECPFLHPGEPEATLSRLSAVNNGKREARRQRGDVARMSGLEKQRRWRKGRKKWIPFGRLIMMAVKLWGGKGGAERDTEETRRAGRETPAIIMVLTFEWKSPDNGSRLRQHPVCKW